MPDQPKLIIVRGLPGSGKSYLAEQVQKYLGSDVVMLDPDGIDLSGEAYTTFSAGLAADGVEKKLHPYRFLRAQAYDGITKDKVIIWNQAFTHQDLLDRTIKNLQAYAEEHAKKLPVLVVEVAIDVRVAKQRVAERHEKGGHNVTPETFERFIADYKTFKDYGYPVVEVQGDANVEDSVTKMLDALNKL